MGRKNFSKPCCLRTGSDDNFAPLLLQAAQDAQGKASYTGLRNKSTLLQYEKPTTPNLGRDDEGLSEGCGFRGGRRRRSGRAIEARHPTLG